MAKASSKNMATSRCTIRRQPMTFKTHLASPVVLAKLASGQVHPFPRRNYHGCRTRQNLRRHHPDHRQHAAHQAAPRVADGLGDVVVDTASRSEEHTSELQSPDHL